MQEDKNLKKLKTNLAQGKIVYGLAISSRSPIYIEMAGYIGFDYVYIDTQHVPIGSDLELENLIRAADVSGIVPVVRVKENEEYFIRCALESGAKGIVIPRVSSKEEAQKAVQACRFPLAGKRHGNPHVRSAKWGCGDFDWDSFVKLSNEEVMVIPLVEDKEGIDNLDEILSVEGIDALSFGPTDYALSLGLNLNYDYDNPIIDEAFQKCLAAAKEKNIPVLDTFAPLTPEKSKEVAAMGMRFQLVGSDNGLVAKALKEIMDNVITKCREDQFT